jgi:hypothetical protein
MVTVVEMEGGLGAEVLGLDLSIPLNDTIYRDIRSMDETLCAPFSQPTLD